MIRRLATFRDSLPVAALQGEEEPFWLSGELIAYPDLQHRSTLTKFIDFLHFTFYLSPHLLVGVSLLITVFLLAIEFLL